MLDTVFGRFLFGFVAMFLSLLFIGVLIGLTLLLIIAGLEFLPHSIFWIPVVAFWLCMFTGIMTATED